MTKSVFLLKLLILCIFLMSGSLLCAQSPANNPNATPYLFEENKGQFHAAVLFRCQLPNGFLFLEKDGFTYLFENTKDKAELMRRFHNYGFVGPEPQITFHQHCVRVQFLDGNPNVTVQSSLPETYHFNYFKSNNPENWQSDVSLYKEITYKNIYQGIDLKVYTSDEGSLKYDWFIHKNASFNAIQMAYAGADSLMINHGKLNIFTTVGNFQEDAPFLVSANKLGLQKQLPACKYTLKNNIISFEIDSEVPLEDDFIIDPKLVFSTYSGSRGDNFGFTATYDSKSNLYAGGITNGAQGAYPVTSGAIQTKYGGGAGFEPANLACDITISKYDSAGTTLLWATYLGGELDEYPHSLVVDRDDDLLIFGTTYSDDFPTTVGAYDRSFNGEVDIIVTKISANGKVLMGSTFIGGSGVDGLNDNPSLRHNYADDFRGDIIPDEDKNVFIASCTESNDFPLVNAFDSKQEFQEGCILELNSDLSQLLWSSFIGGSGRDALYSIKVDSDSSVYVGGGTSSPDMIKSDSVLHDKYLGAVDGFVAKLDRKNKKLNKLTHWGTASYDQVYFVDLDFKGHVYVAGQTNGNIEPSNGVYGTANRGQFVAKLDTSLNKVIWQTSFGVKKNAVDISPSAFLVDNCEHIYVSGWGSNVRPDLNPGSTTGLETTSDAIQKTTDGNDFYILVLNKDASSLLYATYFGGDTTGDHVDGGTSRFDKRGVVYQSVCSSCPNASEPGHQDFPITPGAAFVTNTSPRCSNASFKIDLQIKSAVDAYFVPDPVIGCNPVTVTFTNKSDIVKRFIWDFGDGTKDSVNLNPVHLYDKPGDYQITLTVIDSNTCNISDAFHRNITVLGGSKADFEFKVEGCTNITEFKTKSEGLAFLWVLGDGDSSQEKTFKHIYPPGGKYDVWLYVNPGTLCADSIKKQVNTADPGKPEIGVYNIFTPNGDGINDTYCIEGFIPECDEIDLRIYNRWGELVYKSQDMTQCWDGLINGTPKQYPDGTYFYILKVKYGVTGVKETMSGTVTLLGSK